jgi:hypothetical protein
MNAKESREKLENLVKDAVLEFQKETGLEIYYIDVKKQAFTGFNNKEDVNIKVKLKED